MKIAIITDSGSGFTKQEAENKGMFYLPLQIILDEKMYLDGINISTEDVYEILNAKGLPTTSMPLLGHMEELMEELEEKGYDSAIAITLTPGLSGTAQILQASAKEHNFPLELIDTYSTAEIQRYLCECAKELVDKGYSVEEIASRLRESIKYTNTLIIPDDLNHLKRGGRLTPLAAALGGLLKIKPVLQLNPSTEGKIDVCTKVRTMNKAIAQLADKVEEAGVNEDYLIYALHSDAKENFTALNEALQTRFPKQEIITGSIRPVLVCHTGMGCLGIQYIKKVNKD